MTIYLGISTAIYLLLGISWQRNSFADIFVKALCLFMFVWGTFFLMMRINHG